MPQDGTRPNIFPTLRYRDANRAIEWLVEAFGFDERDTTRDSDGIVVHAELQLGAGMIMLGQHDDSAWMGGRAPDALASTSGVYAIIENPDAHYAQARAAGADIVREIVDMPYGSREYSARDLEGNLWSFGTYDPYTYEGG
jgi:uncharacterized glyoxalase superfamily protein PhnB